MTDRFLFGIIIDDTIIKNSEAKWREKDRKKIKGLVSGGNLPYHAQRSEKKTNIWTTLGSDPMKKRIDWLGIESGKDIPF